MYRTVIELKEGLPKEKIEAIKEICIQAHQNRVGSVAIKERSEREFVFEGTFEEWNCLNLALMDLLDKPLLTTNVESWRWEDEEPGESCDMLKLLPLALA